MTMRIPEREFHGFNTEELHLRENEKVISVVRKHWFVFLKDVFTKKTLLFLPLLLLLIPSSWVSDHTMAYVVFFAALWMLGLLMAIITIWTNYYLDLWIVTNQRLIDIEQNALFNREVKTLRMETIQDIQVNIENVIETLLNFGTLRVQTAGTGGTDALIIGVPNPNFERDIIMEQVRLINARTVKFAVAGG